MFGEERYQARGYAIQFLLRRQEEPSGFTSLLSPASIWGGGHWRPSLYPNGSKSDFLNDLERSTRRSQGRESPPRLQYGIQQGLMGPFYLPRIDLQSGRAGYRGALPKSLGSFGVSTHVHKAPCDQKLPPNP